MNVILCYSPTNHSSGDDKDEFYLRLHSNLELYPENNLAIFMGDLSTKVGMGNTEYEDIMRRQGLGETRFLNLCALKKMVIGDTRFPQKCIHKPNSVSPDHTTENQTDHICIIKKFTSSMKDVRTRRKADIASDHHQPVEFKIKQKIKKHWTIRKTALKRFNTDFHRHTDKPNKSKITLNNRFHVLQDVLVEEEEETDMEDNWRGIKVASTSTCQQVVSCKRHHRNEWIYM